MTPEQLEISLRVIKRITTQFSYYQIDDIQQEAFLMCEDIISHWDGIRSLENFLASSLRRRIVSLRRDTYYRPGSENATKKRALIDFVQEEESELEEIPIEDRSCLADEVQHILDNLPVNMRSDFLRLANGVSLSPTRKSALYNKVREIHGEIEEDW